MLGGAPAIAGRRPFPQCGKLFYQSYERKKFQFESGKPAVERGALALCR
jgi:hypothetical protein